MYFTRSYNKHLSQSYNKHLSQPYYKYFSQPFTKHLSQSYNKHLPQSYKNIYHHLTTKIYHSFQFNLCQTSLESYFSIVPHFHDLFVHSVCLFFLAHLLSPLIRKKTNYKHSNVHYRRHRQHLLLQTQSSSFITYPAIIIHHKPSTHHPSPTQP